MPRKPIDYSKTIIYKIVCKDEDCDYLYVGSTTDFTRRKQNHKSNCNNPNSKEYNNKKYIEIRNNGGWTNFKMVQIKEFHCENKRQAEAEEDKVMIELKANMNTCRAYRTKEQYYEDNKEYYEKYQKQYREDNKEKIKKYKNQKYNCSCGGKYIHNNKSQHFKTKLHQHYLEQNK